MIPSVAIMTALAASVGMSTTLAQSSNCPPTFQGCLDSMSSFLSGTCMPLKRSNTTYYNQCLCYYYVNLGYCYYQCPNDYTTQQFYIGTVQPQTTQTCGAVGLDPKNLPNPAPWVTYTVQSTTTTIAPSQSTTTNQAATTTKAGSSNTGVAAAASDGPIRSDATSETSVRIGAVMASLAAIALASTFAM